MPEFQRESAGKSGRSANTNGSPGQRYQPSIAVHVDPDSRAAVGPLASLHASNYVKPRVALIGYVLESFALYSLLIQILVSSSSFLNIKVLLTDTVPVLYILVHFAILVFFIETLHTECYRLALSA